MKFGSRAILGATAAALVVWLSSMAVIGAQDTPGQRPPMAEEVFKNVQILKGIPVDQFMGTMGFFPRRLDSTAPTATSIKAVATGRGTPTTTRGSKRPAG